MYDLENTGKGKRIFIYVTVAVASFLIGWQATNFGLITNLSGAISGVNNQKKEITDSVQKTKDKVDMGLYWTVWDELENRYADKDSISEEDRVYGGIKGLVSSFKDPYTVFMTPDESKDFSDSLEGTLEGIGAELTVENNNLVIVSPLKKSPSEKAGLLPGDVIYKIDGKMASELTLFDAITKIRGKKGSTVTLTIIRKDLKEPFDVSIVREGIDIKSVTVEKLKNGIIFVSVNQFNAKTNEEFSKAISDMILQEPKGLIVDLRFNGGGYLETAVDLLSYLLPTDANAVEIRQRGKDNEMIKTKGGPKILNAPLVILVNEGSASASEITAGSIQDNKRGIVMGTKTFGKGSVQEVENFADGSSLRLTIAKWFTPKGKTVNHVGLMPDIVVEMDKNDVKNKVDTQKDAAIKYLENLKK